MNSISFRLSITFILIPNEIYEYSLAGIDHKWKNIHLIIILILGDIKIS